MSEPTKKGELFSRLYVERGSPLPDSQRFRVRIAQYFNEILREKHRDQIVNAIPRELGAEVPWFANYGYSVEAFFKNGQILDVLCAITLVHRVIRTPVWDGRGNVTFKPTPHSDGWLQFITRVFQEENLAYTIDDQCGVHPLIDLEFERNIASVVAGLGASRYKAVRTAFEAAKAKLEQTAPDMKGAIRDTFEAVETLTKLITHSGKALDAGFVRAEIVQRVKQQYADDAVAQRSGGNLALSLADWVDAAHPYRHGHEAENPVALPGELAILLISQAASFIRWLVGLDQGQGGGE